MQLRVARLCLDCEELFVGESCPVCASHHYAFLARWLPSDERRKWRRAPVGVVEAPKGLPQLVRAFHRAMARLFDEEPPRARGVSPRTRASDFVPAMKFDAPETEPKSRPGRAADPAKSNVR